MHWTHKEHTDKFSIARRARVRSKCRASTWPPPRFSLDGHMSYHWCRPRHACILCACTTSCRGGVEGQCAEQASLVRPQPPLSPSSGPSRPSRPSRRCGRSKSAGESAVTCQASLPAAHGLFLPSRGKSDDMRRHTHGAIPCNRPDQSALLFSPTIAQRTTRPRERKKPPPSHPPCTTRATHGPANTAFVAPCPLHCALLTFPLVPAVVPDRTSPTTTPCLHLFFSCRSSQSGCTSYASPLCSANTVYYGYCPVHGDVAASLRHGPK